jgi:cytochrome c oxidase subunit IV
MTTGTSSQAPSMKLFVVVWFGLILLTGVEVILTYSHPAVGTLLALLLGLGAVGAAMMIMYFMGMRHERPILFWSLFPYLIFALFMMDHIWPDAHRVLQMRLPIP